MTTPKNDGGPAFPVIETIDADSFGGASGNPKHYVNSTNGMSLRDWFAGMALQGMLAADFMKSSAGQTPSVRALHAYQYADAMISERNK